MSDFLGRQFGNHNLVKLLGEGGFAQVYLGEHIHLGTHAAIKVLTTQLTEDGVQQFRNEARTIIGLEHTNMVRVHDFSLQGRIPFIVMSYAPNGSLRKRHPRGTRLSLQTVVSYTKQISSALHFAHEQKIIHRDIKPDNMLIGRNNEILLSDFGIAVIAHSTRSLETQYGGTLYYMAPEQIQGKPRIASDQYALGIVIYEWLSGSPPFIGTATEIGMQHLLTPPPSLHEQIPTISRNVEQVIFKALAKDPQQRFAGVKDFTEALEQASLPTPPNQPQRQQVPPPPVAPTGVYQGDRGNDSEVPVCCRMGTSIIIQRIILHKCLWKWRTLLVASAAQGDDYACIVYYRSFSVSGIRDITHSGPGSPLCSHA